MKLREIEPLRADHDITSRGYLRLDGVAIVRDGESPAFPVQPDTRNLRRYPLAQIDRGLLIACGANTEGAIEAAPFRGPGAAIIPLRRLIAFHSLSEGRADGASKK